MVCDNDSRIDGRFNLKWVFIGTFCTWDDNFVYFEFWKKKKSLKRSILSLMLLLQSWTVFPVGYKSMLCYCKILKDVHLLPKIDFKINEQEIYKSPMRSYKVPIRHL